MTGHDVVSIASAVFPMIGYAGWFLVGRAAGMKAERARVAELNAVRHERIGRSA